MDDYQNPKVGKTYISPRLDSFGLNKKKIRIASKVIESPDAYAFSTIKDEVVLRHTKDAKTFIKATFCEETRGISVLNIQCYSVATGKPH
ncbi:MAG: DUF4263 domain-containing protein, partial [Psychrobacter sp.]|nr:DUF4263 domain-containing protein [Psychrobacter sp.]